MEDLKFCRFVKLYRVSAPYSRAILKAVLAVSQESTSDFFNVKVISCDDDFAPFSKLVEKQLFRGLNEVYDFLTSILRPFPIVFSF